MCLSVCVGKGLTEYKVLKVKSGFWPQTRPCNDNYDDVGEDFDRYYIYNDDTHDNDEVDDIAQASHAWKFTFSSQTLLMQNVSNPSDSGSTHHKILLKIGWRWIPQNISKNTATFGQYFKVNWLGAEIILELEWILKKYFNMAVFGPPVKFTFARLLLSIKLQVKVKAAAVWVVDLDNYKIMGSDWSILEKPSLLIGRLRRTLF